MCNFGQTFYDKKIYSAASPGRPAGASMDPKRGVHTSWSRKKVVRKIC